MADLARKKPTVVSLNRFASQKAAAAIEVLGKSLPYRVTAVNGQTVTTAFELNSIFTLPPVTMALATSVYDWIPVQVGDKGVASPADVYTGGVSGLGTGTADLSQRANLATLRAHPIANASWTPPGGDSNKRAIQGPNGVYLQDMDGKATIKLDKTDGIALAFGGHTIVINSTGVIIDGKVFLTHEHTGVTPGGGDTGPVA